MISNLYIYLPVTYSCHFMRHIKLKLMHSDMITLQGFRRLPKRLHVVHAVVSYKEVSEKLLSGRRPLLNALPDPCLWRLHGSSD